MPQQLLNCPDVVPVLEEVRCKRVTKGMTGRGLGDPGFESGFFDSPLDHGFVKVVPPFLSGASIDEMSGGGKDPLPCPLFPGVGVFPFKGIGQGDPT